jgi:lipopolysaccharide/colanic/teichoic acid biosynthesis glycosyltransferase
MTIELYKRTLKPIIDWFLAFIAVILLIPVYLVVAVSIKLDSRGPVFFVQERLGKNGKIFNIIKFRSMSAGHHRISSKKLFEDDPRITRVGRFIRKTSLDEIPQLFNILAGDMSFIGPRPPVPYYPKKYDEYNDFELQRFAVKPGIGGLAQVRCREIHDWDINIPIDVEYVQSYSFVYDVRLFLASLLSFFRSDNIYRQE